MGTIVINGGNNEATGGIYGAGIGGGNDGTMGTIIITGGKNVANGGRYGAGIGGGYKGIAGTIKISGGTTYAIRGQYSAYDIGNGNLASGSYVYISGGTVFMNTGWLTVHREITTTYFPRQSSAYWANYGFTLPSGWLAGLCYSVANYVNYDDNGGTGSTTEVYPVSSIISISSSTGFSKNGYTFSHWNTAADDSGTTYNPGDSITLSSDMKLYAIWATIAVNSVTLSSHYESLYTGEVATLNTTVSPADAADSSVTWTSSDTSVAIVSNSGVVEAVSEGTATITAEADGKSDICDVTVKSKDVTTLSISYGSKKMIVGELFALTAIVEPDYAANSIVSWDTSDYHVATVNSSGVITARSTGTCMITARAGGKTDSCKVTVYRENVAVESVSLSMANNAMIVMYVGDVMALSANVSPGNADNPSLTWQSSNPDAASVTSFGKVTAVSEGEATITVLAGDKTDSYRVTVKAIEETGEYTLESPETESHQITSAPTAMADVVYTLQIDTTSLPNGTHYIELPNGEVIKLNGEDTVSCEICGSELENGVFKIVALDAEKNALGSVDVTAEDGGISSIVILLIILGAVIFGAGGMLIMMRIIASKKDE